MMPEISLLKVSKKFGTTTKDVQVLSTRTRANTHTHTHRTQTRTHARICSKTEKHVDTHTYRERTQDVTNMTAVFVFFLYYAVVVSSVFKSSGRTHTTTRLHCDNNPSAPRGVCSSPHLINHVICLSFSTYTIVLSRF